MATLLLIRHGETEYVKLGKLAGRTPGVHLNDKGSQEARELAVSLKKYPVKAIYSSPMERTRETAKPLAEEKGLAIRVIRGLNETDIGDWKGLDLKILGKKPEWKTVQHSPSRFRFPGGESFQEEQTRLVNSIEEIVSLHKEKDLIAIFSHADPIKLTVAYYLGIPLDNFQRISCGTGSISILRLSKSGTKVLGLNLRPSLGLPQY